MDEVFLALLILLDIEFTKVEGPILFNASRNALRKDELGVEIMQISVPTILALTADPIASLIDTAFIGHIGLFKIFLFSICLENCF